MKRKRPRRLIACCAWFVFCAVTTSEAQITIERTIEVGVNIPDGGEYVSTFVWTNSGLTNITGAAVRVQLSSPSASNPMWLGDMYALLVHGIGDTNARTALLFDYAATNNNLSASWLDQTFAVAHPLDGAWIANNQWSLLVGDGEYGGLARLDRWILSVTGDTSADATIDPGAGGTISGSGDVAGSILVQESATNSSAVKINVATLQTMTLAGGLTGGGEVRKEGEGKLVLAGDSDGFSGLLKHAVGEIEITSSTALGSNGGLAIVGTNARVILGNAAPLFNALTLDPGVQAKLDGSGSWSGTVSGAGGLLKQGGGTVFLAGSNDYSGGTTLSGGILWLQSTTAAGTGAITQSNGSTLVIDTTGIISNVMSIYNVSTLQTVTLTGNKTLNNSTFTVATDTTTTEAGDLDGEGGVTKEGAGTLILTGSNSYTGAVAVNAGILNLNSSTGGAAASTSSVSVADGAKLLVSQSNQVNDSAGVTLSGGTIARASGVSEVFGSLNLTVSSFLDFSGGTGGTIEFSSLEYTPGALLSLQLLNFSQGNALIIRNTSNWDDQINSGFTFSGTGGFGGSSFSDGTFTITAIPEPASAIAALGLLFMMLYSPAAPPAAGDGKLHPGKPTKRIDPGSVA
jgi:autotransporter-associated beta strand protein